MRVHNPEGRAKAQGGETGGEGNVCVLAPCEPLDDACWAILNETKTRRDGEKANAKVKANRGTRGPARETLVAWWLTVLRAEI